MKIRITFTESMLGTASANPDIHKEFIASKSADAKRIQEEIEALPADEKMEKSITVFPRNAEGDPILWDYQVKGFLKESLTILMGFQEPETKIGKFKLSMYTAKRIVDNAVMVTPREINLYMPQGASVALCTRPLRAETMRGERVALATSEMVPRGTAFEIEIMTLDKKLDVLVKKCLDYGAHKGIGQWRNSGRGRFEWTEVE